MKLFTQILILIGFAITTVKVTAESDENQLLPPEVKFSAESDYLVIPDGVLEGTVISKQKFGTALTEYFEDPVEVDTISIVDDLYFMEGLTRGATFGFVDVMMDYDVLTVSFRIKTNRYSDAVVYLDIQCAAYGYGSYSNKFLRLFDCESEDVKFNQTGIIGIPINDVDVEFIYKKYII